MTRSATVHRISNSRTIEHWAEIIRSKWQDNVKSIFAVALDIETSHEELGPAMWLKMMRDELKWSKQTGYKLLAIARDDKLAEVAHERLPASWQTLFELTRLTPEQFETGLSAGIIHAGMERKDIAQLKPPKPKPAKSAEPELHGRELVERRTMEARQTLVAMLRPMTPEEQGEFLALLRLQLDDIETKRAA